MDEDQTKAETMLRFFKKFGNVLLLGGNKNKEKEKREKLGNVEESRSQVILHIILTMLICVQSC